MVWGVDGRCTVCIIKVVENGAVMVCERTNEHCELQGLMKHDKLGDMGHFVPMKKEVY
jgi:hypothetical protein